MEQIRQAVERAKANAADATPEQQMRGDLLSARLPLAANVSSLASAPRINEADLSSVDLEASRIIAHNAADPRSKSFDMLRTQVLQAMDQRNWQFLAITSPTPGCGKTVVAANLALSIARQPERSAFLVDLDLQRPSVASTLGLKCRQGVLGVLEGRATLADAIAQARINTHQLLLLPTEAPRLGSAELIASRAMSAMLQGIKRDFKFHTVILDLPPMLASDDVIALLPQVDCVVLVAAVGTSTVSEIKECNKHLQSAEVVRLVLNKASEQISQYYY
jgi:protein-tyrosine kinase